MSGIYETIDSLDKDAVVAGQNMAYGGKGLNIEQFTKNASVIEETIIRSKEEGSELILIIPPALFGQWRGHARTLKFAQKMKDLYNVEVLDASMTMMNNPHYYYDSYHLNTQGVVYFTRNYLRPALLKMAEH